MPNHRNATNPQLLTSKNLLLQGWSVLTCQCDSVSGFLQSRQLLFKQNWSRGNCPPTSSSQLKFFGSETDLQSPLIPILGNGSLQGPFGLLGSLLYCRVPYLYSRVPYLYFGIPYLYSRIPYLYSRVPNHIPESLIIFQSPY